MFDCTIVIPLFNNVEYTYACLARLAEVTPDELYEVVLVDNGSTDATSELLEQLEGDVTIIRNEQNVGFSHACNQGAAAARGRSLLFLNNDTVPHDGWLEPLLAALDEPGVGIVGAKLLFPNGTIQHGGVLVIDDPTLPLPLLPVHLFHETAGDTAEANMRRDLTAVTGACMLVRRELFETCNGFDEEYWNGFEDIDLCLRVGELGWRIVYEPASTLMHHESVSGPERFAKQEQNLARLNSQWRDRLLPEAVRCDDGQLRRRSATAAFPRAVLPID